MYHAELVLWHALCSTNDLEVSMGSRKPNLPVDPRVWPAPVTDRALLPDNGSVVAKATPQKRVNLTKLFEVGLGVSPQLAEME